MLYVGLIATLAVIVGLSIWSGTKAKTGGKIGRKKREAKPKFVDFDVEDAFQRALQRSYGNDENDN